MSGDSKDSGVGGDSSIVDTSSSTKSTPILLVPAQVNRSRYNSPLSSFRNNYKPPPNSPDFKPNNFSSPKCSMMIDVASTPTRSTFPSADRDPALSGSGGEWRGPTSGDMQPNHRKFTPRGGHRGSPYNRGGNRNFDHFRGNSPSYGGNSSYGGHSSFGNCSMGSQQSTLYSPYQSSDGNNSSFNNRRGSNSHNNSRNSYVEDFSKFVHPSMTEDPWLDLVSQKRNGNAAT